jgi:hypothetical protein
VQQHLPQADHLRVLDLDPGDLRLADLHGESPALAPGEVDGTVEPLGSKLARRSGVLTRS